MPPVAGDVTQTVRVPTGQLLMPTTGQPYPAGMMTEAFAKDAIIAWFRGEFAAANAIIDALCNHLTQLEGGGGTEYESVFAAIHRRRMNWIPILQMQKYYSITDVAVELRKVAAKKVERDECEGAKKIDEVNFPLNQKNIDREVSEEVLTESDGNGGGEVVDADSIKDDKPESEITDTGSQDQVQPVLENTEICSNHAECEERHARIKMTKGFVAKEPVKGHMVNVVRGLKMYEDVFTDVELTKLKDFVTDLRAAGHSGELSGETFILYNRQLKGTKRELIQLGAPIFGQIKDKTSTKCEKSHIEPIPPLLQGVIDHLIQWHLLSENRRPNGCIINFFDEGEFSQPFMKPPHLEQPICTLLLSESTMAFGRTLVTDNEGNYKGPLILSLNQGSIIVMRGNSADTARHVMCSSPNKRVSITFIKVRENNLSDIPIPPLTQAMTLWQPGHPTQNIVPADPMNLLPKWGLLRAPLVMVAPARPMVLGSKRMPRGGSTGTGVFLPWTVGSRKHHKHLPPRAQRARLLALPSPQVETTHKTEAGSDG